MIDPKYTELLYNTLCNILNAIDHDDVLEVGGLPLQYAYDNANDLLDEIDTH